jgi:hypothetical protein
MPIDRVFRRRDASALMLLERRSYCCADLSSRPATPRAMDRSLRHRLLLTPTHQPPGRGSVNRSSISTPERLLARPRERHWRCSNSRHERCVNRSGGRGDLPTPPRFPAHRELDSSLMAWSLAVRPPKSRRSKRRRRPAPRRRRQRLSPPIRRSLVLFPTTCLPRRKSAGNASPTTRSTRKIGGGARALATIGYRSRGSSNRSAGSTRTRICAKRRFARRNAKQRL